VSQGNVVTLTGEFCVVDFKFVKRKGQKFLEAEAIVRTGPESEGGVHKVFLHSETARLTMAFIKANGSDGMLVTVKGTLYSTKENPRVVVDWISFHVPKDIAEKGQRIFLEPEQELSVADFPNERFRND